MDSSVESADVARTRLLPMTDTGAHGLALDVRHLGKTFPGTVALSDVALQLRPGEIHALMGQNGSGKSTLIKILAGFHPADPGAVAHVEGLPISLGDPAAARHAGLRFVHQDLGLVGSLDAADNLALGAGYVTGPGFRILWRRQRSAASDALDALGHAFDVRRQVDSLSAVERTTLAIARALRDIENVRVLVLDEPTAAMPQPDVERLHGIVRRVRDSGVAVLYVSHHIDEVLALADRVTVLRDGRSVATRPVIDLTPHALVELMTGSVTDQAAAAVRLRPVASIALEVTGLSGVVLRDFDLSVRSGEVVGIAGIDGSGRDELCNAIFGGRARRGIVAVGGVALPPLRPDLSVSAGVGFVPSARATEGLITPMTVKENLTLTNLRPYTTRYGINGRAERSDVRMWTSRLSVRTPRIDTTLDHLSGGNQQKIAMGKWLRLKPKLLLLDEPTQGVDIAAKVELHKLIDEAAVAGAAVIVCSSDEKELVRLCDRVLVLRRGRRAQEFDRCVSALSASAIARECLRGATSVDLTTEGQPATRPSTDETARHPSADTSSFEVRAHVTRN